MAPPRTKASFYRTSSGAEVDLVLELPGGEKWAIEIKSGLAPKPEKGFYNALEDIQPNYSFVIYAGLDHYPLTENIDVISLVALAQKLDTYHTKAYVL